MTKSFRFLPRFVAHPFGSSRRQVALRALAACLLSGLLSGSASAQLIDELSFEPIAVRGQSPEPNRYVPTVVEPTVIGSAVAEQGVVVGPGGPTSIAEMPSTVAPSSSPVRGRMASFNQGPYVQSPPVYGNQGYEIPCPCDEGCDFSWYGGVEALYFRREYDQQYTLSQGNRMSGFEYEWGGKLTVGRLTDCVNAWEFVYAGPFKWNRSVVNAAAGTLQSNLVPSGGYVPASINTFNNANIHQQDLEARLSNYEFNFRKFSWDVLSVIFGIRAIDYREDYTFQSVSGLGNGFLQYSTRNIMVGPQVGGDLRTPIGLRGLLGFRGKAGILANFNRDEAFVQNGAAVLVNGAADDLDVAGIFDFGVFGVYSITPSVRLTGGYDFWYMPGVATIVEQGPNQVYPNAGFETYATDDVFVHGASAGVEILY